jgi:hypothetical protein
MTDKTVMTEATDREVDYNDIEGAWWTWGRASCTGRGKSARTLLKWMYANMDKFMFDGETWTRSAGSFIQFWQDEVLDRYTQVG